MKHIQLFEQFVNEAALSKNIEILMYDNDDKYIDRIIIPKHQFNKNFTTDEIYDRCIEVVKGRQKDGEFENCAKIVVSNLGYDEAVYLN